GQQVAVIAYGPSLAQVFSERFANYAVAVFILMFAMLCASQLLIRFLLSQLNTLKDVMLHVLQGVELTEQEADQQLRSAKHGEHQDKHGNGVVGKAFAEHLRQAWAVGDDCDLLS